MGKLTAWLGRGREQGEGNHAGAQARDTETGSSPGAPPDVLPPSGEHGSPAPAPITEPPAGGPLPAGHPESPPDAPEAAPETGERAGASPEDLEPHIIDALKGVYDPEIPVNIYDLGLIYRIDVSPDRDVEVDMTVTAPGCPVAQTFPMMVEQAIEAVPGVRSARVEIVWDPPWTPERMSEAARLELGWL